MGKNHRHTKKLKSEKNKVHIKSKTKFLPKGQNVTNTTFKIRPIIVQEQLKDKDATSSTIRKKINVEDATIKLKHFNDTIKVEACQDLRVIITEQSLEKQLSSIIQNASGLIQHRERKVRRASIKLLNVIFAKVPTTTLRAFSNYILTNLKCAMTNINKNIQEDSLLLLDALIEHQSLLIAENFDGIFPNFLMLISKLKNGNERSLSLNLEGKVTSVKWRVKVLSRLYGILSAIIRDDERDDGVKSKYLTIYAKDANYIPIFRDISIYENIDFVVTKQDCTQFETHILNLVQLLHEIWIEAVPQKKNSSEPTILPNQESIAVFSCIVHILHLLDNYIRTKNMEIWSHNKSILFLDHLIQTFPYTHNKKNLQEISKEFSSCFILNSDQQCTEENLIIIKLYITERLRNVKNNKIGMYLTNCLKTQKHNSKSIGHLINILKIILIEHPYLARKLAINIAEITENLVDFYKNVKIPDSCKTDILNILTHSSVQGWVEKLPGFLRSDKISAKVIDTVLDLAKKGHQNIQSRVKMSLKVILNNLPTLVITDTEDLPQAQMNLVSIFFYLSDLSNEDLTEIDTFVNLHPDLVYSKHFKNILELRTILGK